MLSHHIPSGPGGLQVETACDGIYVQYLSGKEEMRTCLAFQGVEVDIAEADATAGYKLFLVRSLAIYLIKVVGQGLYQEIAALLSHFAPFLLWRKSHLLDKVEPKARREIIRADAGELLLWIGAKVLPPFPLTP